MVPHSRTPLGAHPRRALNVPAQLTVHADALGQPLTVRRTHAPRPCTVARIQDCWRIDDEWWRARPISRLYFVLVLDNDTLLTVYHDLITGVWFEQRG